jgi:hypothetical protein
MSGTGGMMYDKHRWKNSTFVHIDFSFVYIYIEENFIKFLKTKAVQRISKHFLNDINGTSGCFRAHMERLLTLYKPTSTKIRKITCMQLHIVWHQPENRNTISIIFKENALKQMFISKKKHSKPIIKTRVYTTHLLWRQTFCGANLSLSVNYNLVFSSVRTTFLYNDTK